jgi:hypothetical protein
MACPETGEVSVTNAIASTANVMIGVLGCDRRGEDREHSRPGHQALGVPRNSNTGARRADVGRRCAVSSASSRHWERCPRRVTAATGVLPTTGVFPVWETCDHVGLLATDLPAVSVGWNGGRLTSSFATFMNRAAHRCASYSVRIWARRHWQSLVDLRLSACR